MWGLVQLLHLLPSRPSYFPSSHPFGLWGRSFSYSSTGQIPISLWLTLLFWQPLSFQVTLCTQFFNYDHKTSLPSFLSFLTVGTDSSLPCLFTPVSINILSRWQRCHPSSATSSLLPCFEIHTLFHRKTYLALHSSANSAMCWKERRF